MNNEQSHKIVVTNRPSKYKRDPKRVIKDIQLEMVTTKDQMRKLIELSKIKGCTRQEVIRRLIEEEHLIHSKQERDPLEVGK